MNERIKRDGVAYDRWARAKYLTATPGDAVDYDFVETRLLAMNELYEVAAICPDPWNSRMLTQRLSKNDIQIIEVPQTMAGESPAMKEMERLMKWGRYTHENNPVARWCFGNASIATDGNGNVKLFVNEA